MLKFKIIWMKTSQIVLIIKYQFLVKPQIQLKWYQLYWNTIYRRAKKKKKEKKKEVWKIRLICVASDLASSEYSKWIYLLKHNVHCKGETIIEKYQSDFENSFSFLLYSLHNGLALIHTATRASDGVHQSAWHNHMWYHLRSGRIVTTPLESQLPIN